MYYSIRGIIAKIESKMLVVECNGIGYEVFVSKPSFYQQGEEAFFLLYHHKFQDAEYLVGFQNYKEKETFMSLIHVNGIGPKGAIGILSHISCDELLDAVMCDDIDVINSIPGISKKTAMQIVLDLKDYIKGNKYKDNETYAAVRNALKNFKFSVKEIDQVLPRVFSYDSSKEEILKNALRRLQNV